MTEDTDADRAAEAAIAERDEYADLLDQFAAAVPGNHGEHSSENDPWTNALAALLEVGPQLSRNRVAITRLLIRAELAEARLARVAEQLQHECPHGEMSWSGVDQTDLDDPAKVWACDNCGKVLDDAGVSR